MSKSLDNVIKKQILRIRNKGYKQKYGSYFKLQQNKMLFCDTIFEKLDKMNCFLRKCKLSKVS